MKRLSVLLLVTLAGCATLNENECRTADWRDIGLQDGRAGHPLARLAEHREACVKHGIVPDDRLYGVGRDMGLREYCVLGKAIDEGLAGRRYSGVCPPGVHRAFEELNAAAYAVYDARREMTTVDGQIDSLERELRQEKTPEKRRLRIRDEIRDLDRKRERLRDELRWRERDLDRLADDLSRGKHAP